MTTSSAANGPAYAFAVGVHVIERNVDPPRKVSHFLFIAAKCPQLAALAERMDRLAREPEQRRSPARRYKPSAMLFEQTRQFRITRFAVRFRHCQTIVAQTSAPPRARARSRQAWG